MEFSVKPADLLATLKRLLPHTNKAKLIKRGPLVTLVAEGDAIDVIGQFESRWSVPAEIHASGSCAVDLVAFSKMVAAYPPKEPLRFVLHPDGLRFGSTKIRGQVVQAGVQPESMQVTEGVDLSAALLLAQVEAAEHFRYQLTPCDGPDGMSRYLVRDDDEPDSAFHWFLVFQPSVMGFRVGGDSLYVRVHKTTGRASMETRWGE